MMVIELQFHKGILNSFLDVAHSAFTLPSKCLHLRIFIYESDVNYFLKTRHILPNKKLSVCLENYFCYTFMLLYIDGHVELKFDQQKMGGGGIGVLISLYNYIDAFSTIDMA